ncbi:M23 family metallopeptidase [Microbacterium gorillae]|uniref:M23 family metallopeptidase n=1 Tax=Microbacterium gorillae TaxID=1231063 RepID=UPI003D9945BB
MGTYLRPVANATIEDSWQGHKNRNPPSAEPGTDYGCAYGSNVLAATNGVIQYVDTNPDGADGRVVGLAADDGNYIRYLHLSQSLVSVGQRVTRGQAIAKSGGSGNGSNTYYGAHVHVSLWIGGTPSSQGYANTVDFENYIGNTITTDPEELMLILVTTSASSDGAVKANQAYADNLVGPLVLLSSLEHGALDYWAGRGVPYRRADWSGNDVRNVIRVRGVRPWDPTTGKSTYSTVNY